MAIKLEGGDKVNGTAISGGFFCGFPYETSIDPYGYKNNKNNKRFPFTCASNF